MLRRVAAFLGVVLVTASIVSAQIAIPNTLVAGTTIRAGDLNTNFSTLGNHALDRISGGNISGNVTLDSGITIDGIDLSVALCATCQAAFKDLTLAGTGNGLVVNGVNIIDNTGKIPAISSTYFTSLSGANLTGLPAANLTGTLPALSGVNLTSLTAANLTGTLPAISGVNLTALNGSNIASGTVAIARLPTDTILTGAVRAYQSGAQAIPDTADTAVLLDAENYDTASMHSTSSNTSRVVAPATGYYTAVMTVRFVVNGTGLRYAWIRASTGSVVYGYLVDSASASIPVILQSTDVIYLSVGDYVEIAVHQTSGGNLNASDAALTLVRVQ